MGILKIKCLHQAADIYIIYKNRKRGKETENVWKMYDNHNNKQTKTAWVKPVHDCAYLHPHTSDPSPEMKFTLN